MPSPRRIRGFLALASAAWCAASIVGGPAGAQMDPAPETGRPAVVRLGSREVATLHATVLGRLPEERARAAEQALAKAVHERRWAPIEIRSEESGRFVLVGGEVGLVLVPGDQDAERGETLDAAAASAVARLGQALREAREARSLPDILRAVALAVLATAAFAALLLVTERLLGIADGRLATAFRRWTAKWRPETAVAVAPGVLAATATHLVHLAVRLGEVFAGYVWLTFLLERFPLTRPWGEALGNLLATGASTVGRRIVGALPDLAVVVLIALITRLLAKLVGLFFAGVEKGRISVPPTLVETAQPTRRVVVTLLWIFALISAYPYLPGSGTEAFKGIGVVVGVMVSLGSTAIVGQIFSGFMILYARIFRAGDYVRIGDVEGTILKQGVFATTVLTPWNDVMALPNSVVAAANTRNFSRSSLPDGPLLATRVTIGYDAPWRQVEALLLSAAERTPGLKREPAPFVRQWALADFYVEYELDAHIERPADRIAVLAALHANIQDAFNEHGVQIMSPHYWADPAAAKVVPRDRWFEPPAQPTVDASRAGP